MITETSKMNTASAAGVPSPLVGEGQGGGDCRISKVGVPPTLAPPHKGEGNPVGASAKSAP
jgi:hypothetical protein